jgi:GDP-L-fucose synthase
MKERIFITGGNSFLGHHLLPMFDKAGINYFAPRSGEVDILDINQLDKAINYYQPNMIIHLAAQCGGILKNLEVPASFLWTNTMMALNIFEVIRRYQIPKIYSTGSVCMYPKNCPIPFKEDDILAGSEDEVNKPYGDSKRLLLSLHESFRIQYGTGGAFFVPVNMYGLYDSFDSKKSHVVPALIRRIGNALKNDSKVIECIGDGSAGREFLAAQNAAEAFFKAATTNFDCDVPINLGTGKEISIKDLAHLIAELMGYQGDIVFLNDGIDGQPRRCLNVERAKEKLGWEAKIGLTEGLKQTIEWYRENSGGF